MARKPRQDSLLGKTLAGKLPSWKPDPLTTDQITFAGTAMTASDFLATTQLISYGTAANDTLTGYEGIDYLLGVAGNDSLEMRFLAA